MEFDAWAILPEAFERVQARLDLFTPEERVKAEAAVAAISGRPGYAVKKGSVAVVDVSGPIMHRDEAAAWYAGGITSQRIVANVAAAMLDPQVTAIVMQMDSPGGMVVGTIEAATAIAEMRRTGKPIVALADPLAASAAYWIASAADKVIAIPSAFVGSIGVIMRHIEITGMLEKAGVKATTFRAGKFKALGGPMEALSEEARIEMQGRLDSMYADFQAGIAANRSLDLSAADVWSEGKLFFSAQAKAVGLIDGVGTLGQVISELAAGSGLPTSRAARGQAMDQALEAAAVDAALDNKIERENAAVTPPKEAPKDAKAQAAVASVPPVDAAALIDAERTRAKTIRSKCGMAGLSADFADKLIDNGSSLGEATDQILAAVCRKNQLVGDDGPAEGVEKPKDADAGYRAEYRKDAKTIFAMTGVTEEQWVASRKRTAAQAA